MSVIHFNYKHVRKYSQTFHPPEEIRVQREMASLRRLANPFWSGLQHVSRNAQLRMIEDYARQLGLPHPRMLGSRTDFYGKLEGFDVKMMSFLYFYRKLRKESGSSDSLVDFMLDRLGVPRINELSIEKQIEIVHFMKKISWKATGEAFRVWAIERLAEEAEVVHPRALGFDEFSEIKIPEIDSAIYGLYAMYRDECPKGQTMPDFMLDKLGIQRFYELSWEDQLLCLRASKKIRWERVPYSTQLKLLALLQKKMPKQNGVRCPHLRGLIWTSFDIYIPEIDNSLSGLYAYWKKRTPESYKGRIIDYMLDQLGVKKFEKLDQEIQFSCKRYNRVFPWERMPDESVLHLFDRTAELAEIGHTRALMRRVVASTPLPELGGKTLNALVHRFRPGALGKFEGTSLERALDRYGAQESNLAAQIERYNQYFVRWGEVPDHVIGYYLERLRQVINRIPTAEDMRDPDIGKAVGRETSLAALYNFLVSARPQSYAGKSAVVWALRRYGLGPIRAKRLSGVKFLSQEEAAFLTQAAAAGNKEAADHLAYFYRIYREETTKEITERSIRCLEQLKHPSIDMDFYDIEKATGIPAMTIWKIYNRKEKSTPDILAKLLKLLS